MGTIGDVIPPKRVVQCGRFTSKLPDVKSLEVGGISGIIFHIFNLDPVHVATSHSWCNERSDHFIFRVQMGTIFRDFNKTHLIP